MPKLLINLDVEDLGLAERFYTRALGLRVGRRLTEDFLELLGAGVPIYLLRKARGTKPFEGASDGRTYARHWTPWHPDFLVEGERLEVAVERVKSEGAKIEGPITEHVWGRMALCADPFGHGFCLLELNEKGYDAYGTDPWVEVPNK